MIQVVADSNVYISALVFGGVPSAVLQLAEEGEFTLWVSEPIRAEVEGVLTRKFAWSEQRLSMARRAVWSLTNLVTPRQPVTACDHPADNRILECALDAQAQVIVTGDDDLLRLKRFEGIRILAPRAFLDSHMWA